MQHQKNAPVFDESWETTYASGGKRMNIGQHTEEPDTFVAFGKERGCVESGTWWRVMQLAVSILTASNTKRVVDETTAPSWLVLDDPSNHLRGSNTPFNYTRQPYTYRGRDSYEMNADRFEEYDTTQVELQQKPFDLTSVGTAPTILKREKSISDGEQYRGDQWVRERGLSMKRMRGSWWEFMCFAADVLAAEPTRTVVRALPDRIASSSIILDAPIEELDSNTKPYQFVDDDVATKERECDRRYDF